MPATAKGYRYPADTGAIAYGATDVKNLATDCNTRLGAGCSGKVTLQPANESSKSKTVTFPSGRFTATPQVTVTTSNTNWFGCVGSSGTTSFTCWVRHYQASLATTDIVAYWIARQG